MVLFTVLFVFGIRLKKFAFTLSHIIKEWAVENFGVIVGDNRLEKSK